MSSFKQYENEVDYFKEDSVEDLLLEEEERSLVELGETFHLRMKDKGNIIKSLRKYKSIFCHANLQDTESYGTGQILYVNVSHEGDRFITGSSNGVIKIFDSFSAKLIHSIDLLVDGFWGFILSKDDKYLVIADNSCLLHVYCFDSYKKISQINNLRNSEIIFMDMTKCDSQDFLIVCTKSHGLWVYKKEIFDGSTNPNFFDSMCKLLLPYNSFTCCEISHKSLRINAIDSDGSLYCWEKISEIFKNPQLIHHKSKIIFDQKYRPEILMVNEKLNIILLYNKNTHFFITVEEQNFSIIEEERYPKINMRTHERSVVVNQNSQYCFIAVNIEKKKDDNSGELGDVKSTIYIYEFINPSRINFISKVNFFV
jgi:WD40 repeat protein